MRFIAILLGLIVLALAPHVAGAGGTAVVTITAQPWSTGDCPTGFTLNAVSLYEIQIAWTPGGNTTGTEIRGAYGRWPGNATDGFSVHSGNSSSVTHWVNTEFIGVDVYYRAWGDLGNGTYSLCYASGTIQGGEAVAAIGINMFTGVLGMIALCMSGMAVWSKITNKTMTWLFGASGLAWIILGMYGLSTGAAGTTTHSVGWFGIVMGLVFFFGAFLYRERAEEAPTEGTWDSALESRRSERYEKRYEKRKREELLP